MLVNRNKLSTTDGYHHVFDTDLRYSMGDIVEIRLDLPGETRSTDILGCTARVLVCAELVDGGDTIF